MLQTAFQEYVEDYNTATMPSKKSLGSRNHASVQAYRAGYTLRAAVNTGTGVEFSESRRASNTSYATGHNMMSLIMVPSPMHQGVHVVNSKIEFHGSSVSSGAISESKGLRTSSP